MKKSAFNTMIRYYDTCLEGAGEFLLGRGYTADTLPLAVMEKSIRQHIFFLVNQPGFTYMGRVLQDISVRLNQMIRNALPPKWIAYPGGCR